MNFNDDDSILYPDDSRFQPPPFGNLFPSFPANNSPFPGGSTLNIGPPPNYTPNKNSAEVKKLNSGTNTKKDNKSKDSKTKAVSPGSISFCLFKFTYIWETNGRNYWAFLLNVDSKTVSGFRWFRGTWVYFGVDLKKIDSFICYRNDSTDYSTNDSSIEPAEISNPFRNTKKEYSSNGVRNIYTKVLTSIEVPEIRDDFLINYLGEIDGEEITAKIPCRQTRITNYRIVLQLTYPEEFNEQLIDKINLCANDAVKDTSRYLDEFRDSKNFLTPLEIFNSSTKQIGKSLKVFSNNFHIKLKKLKLPREVVKEVDYTILQEKIEEPWRIL